MNDTHPPLAQKRNVPFLPARKRGGILARFGDANDTSDTNLPQFLVSS